MGHLTSNVAIEIRPMSDYTVQTLDFPGGGGGSLVRPKQGHNPRQCMVFGLSVLNRVSNLMRLCAKRGRITADPVR